MKVIPYRRERELRPFFSAFDSFAKNFFDDDFSADYQRTMAVDIVERDNHFVVEANLPGFKKEDLNISLDNNTLIIEAKKDETKEEKKNTYYCRERYQGSYRREITLSDSVDKTHINARYEDGVLSLEIPKIKPVPAKQIEIS